MIRTLEAVIDEQGRVSLREAVHLSGARRALVTILEEEPGIEIPADVAENEAALLAESSLADWNRPEEDEAWQHLKDLPAIDEDES